MNSLNFCGTSSGGVYPFHGVNSMLVDLRHQMAEQYHAYSAAGPTVHTLTVAERLAGGSVTTVGLLFSFSHNVHPSFTAQHISITTVTFRLITQIMIDIEPQGSSLVAA